MEFAAAAQPKTQQTQPKPQYGGILRLSDMPDGTDIGPPSKHSALYAQRQVAPVIETLFRTDKTGKPIPGLAESYKEDAKGKAITLKLRKGVKFKIMTTEKPYLFLRRVGFGIKRSMTSSTVITPLSSFLHQGRARR